METKTTDLTRISYYAHCKPGLSKAPRQTAPVRFRLAEDFFRLDEEPIRDRTGLTLEFVGDGWESLYLLNFRLTRQWPETKVAWTPHCEPKNAALLGQPCLHLERMFKWRAVTEDGLENLPQDLCDYIDQFLGSDEYVIVKFDALALGRDGHWYFVDPGFGVKP